MTYKIGDRVKIVAPPEAKSLAREGWQGIIIGVGSAVGIYNVQFADKTTDWYLETWLKKVSLVKEASDNRSIALDTLKHLDKVRLYMADGRIHEIDQLGLYKIDRNAEDDSAVDFSITNGMLHLNVNKHTASESKVPSDNHLHNMHRCFTAIIEDNDDAEAAIEALQKAGFWTFDISCKADGRKTFVVARAIEEFR